MLYIVSTPIGNLEDISPRALEVLRSVGTILAEDTRQTKKLLFHYEIRNTLKSYHQHSSEQKLDAILDGLAQQDMALVSDAGTPGISDPGEKLITRAIARGYTVSPVPGASALSLALVASGVDPNRFVFLGFLPRRKGRQLAMLEAALTRRCPVVFYDSPHRVAKTLETLQPAIGMANIVVARELTKKFEGFVRGDYNAVQQALAKIPRKGELTVIIDPPRSKHVPLHTLSRSRKSARHQV